MNIDPKRERWINELIETFFAAFDERPMPSDRFVSPTYDDPTLESVLRSVNRREITPEFVQEMDFYPDGWMTYMTNEGRLHYLPVVMSLSVQELYAPEPHYGVMSESILSLLSPWKRLFSPHDWVALNDRRSAKQEEIWGPPSTLEDWLFDEEYYLNHRGGKLLLSLNPQEKRAIHRWVEADMETCATYPLLVYGICETLEGRIEIGDGYSWLPRHEKTLLVDYIDRLMIDRRDTLTEEKTKRLIHIRQSIVRE